MHSNNFRTTRSKQATRSQLPRNTRRAAAVVEMAVILPIMFLITLGTLETCEGIFLLQKIEIAAHEGARAAIRKKGDLDDVQAAVKSYLDARKINYENDITTVVSVDPSPELADQLTPIEVTVEIPSANNFRMPTSFYKFWTGDTLSAEVVMFKEFDPSPL